MDMIASLLISSGIGHILLCVITFFCGIALFNDDSKDTHEKSIYVMGMCCFAFFVFGIINITCAYYIK